MSLKLFENSGNVYISIVKKIDLKPRGNKSTKVRITQNKGKKTEKSYQKLKRSQ